MHIFTNDFFKRKKADCIVLPFFENKIPLFDREDFDEIIKGPLEEGDFTGKKEQLCILYAKEEKRVILLGLGKQKDVTFEIIRNCFAALIKKCRSIKIKNMSLIYPKGQEKFFTPILEGLLLSNYAFLKLKNKTFNKEDPLVESIQILNIKDRDEEIKKAKIIAQSVHFTRDLVNQNADEVTPQKLGEIAREFEKINPNLKVDVFDKKRIKEEKMGLLLAVNRGSFRDPCFIVIDYTANTSNDRTVLVGKGITYDSGGLSLKTSEGMLTMKTDMSGAGGILGTMYALANLKIDKNVTAIIPATENSIGSKSYKPGDVYTSYCGKTVEVINTDAEGRLILADGIAYCVDKIKPTRIIDMATLTGAIVIALGAEIAGVFSNSDELFAKLHIASQKTGELIHRFPLHEEYKRDLKSNIADIKNIGTKEASSMVAALFLKAFVKDIPWAHIDIAGTARYDKPKGYNTSLATGYGVRLLIEFLESL